MPSVPLHPPVKGRGGFVSPANPLPQLLQTPSGLALLELQGTINLPPINLSDTSDEHLNAASLETPIGRLVFPDHSSTNPPENTAWMKRVYLYVGKHQRLTGEVRKLPNPTAVIRRKEYSQGVTVLGEAEELEIVEIVRWKILFSQRPEPVGS
ncbi:hypothetical protein FGG08_001028 [Glutinoglossum americanum]|uniref:Sister chromatid cohesion protein Ctf8 n=1 Tax=Glutinoglossum americanum TaxID=1670608 RepID=A0A9P8L5M3_9PEZI|nr:hypothetical protein FGG08_001028 [Glutinoglossum americanum]